MSILGKILGPIWERAKAGPGHKPDRTATPTSAPAPTAPPSTIDAGSAIAPQPHVAGGQPVDVDGILDFMNDQRGQKLNWRTSIVDLMKLLGLDSSLDARKQLAAELSYGADTSDSAKMNIWLHRQVMTKLAANGGKVPAELRD